MPPSPFFAGLLFGSKPWRDLRKSSAIAHSPSDSGVQKRTEHVSADRIPSTMQHYHERRAS
ncbi:hypothetical protein GQ53DRAFT_751931 [Thozetella sp. PMI_491]|nr:hypothetical protein GQ53DRAFT_751931 [Thozetella sp. PMI_491]